MKKKKTFTWLVISTQGLEVYVTADSYELSGQRLEFFRDKRKIGTFVKDNVLLFGVAPS